MTEKLWRAVLRCRDCNHILNTAENVPDKDKIRVILSSPLVTGPCPNGCRSTASDCNANTTLEWFPVEQPSGGDPEAAVRKLEI